jgi:cytoskeletal protein CcmA (bactofilin family)
MINYWLNFRKKSLIWGICTLLVILILTILPAWGNQFQAGQTITISSEVVENDDIYLAGETITIDGTVKGDVVVAGKQITINGIVEGDVIAAAQSISIKGKVGDDLRLAAQVIQIGENAQIGDDTIAASFSLETQTNSNIGGSLHFFGAQALLQGKISQNLKGVMGALELAGTVDTDVEVIVADKQIKPPSFGGKPPFPIPEIQSGLTLTDSAKIGGNLSYKSPREATIAQGSQINGTIDYEAIEIVTQPTPTEIILAYLQRLLSLILIAWLCFKFLPQWIPTLATVIKNRPWPSLGWGILSLFMVAGSAIAILIVILILVFLLALTLSNLIFPVFSLGLLVLFSLLIGFSLFSSYVSPIVVGFLGGKWILGKINSLQNPQYFNSAIVGLVVLIILTAIPVLGGLVNLLIALLGLGALWLWATKSRD